MSPSSRTGLATLGGITVGVLLAVVVVVAGGLSSRATAKPKPEATAEFIDAFTRSLGATYVIQADYTRVLDNGRTLQSGAFVAQRPPDRIQREFGGISGTVAGRQIMCSKMVSGDLHCGPAAPAADPATTTAQQISNLQSYFADPALYRVVKGDVAGCFDLTQVRPQPLAPYGSEATMCFDDATGAMRYLRQRIEGAVDTFNAVTIRGFASDQDFSLAQDNSYDSTSDGVEADVGLPTTTTTAAPSGSNPTDGTTATTATSG